MTSFMCQTCIFFGAEHPDYPGLHFCKHPYHGFLDQRLNVVPQGICPGWEANPQAVEPRTPESIIRPSFSTCARFEAYFKYAEGDVEA